MTLPSERSRAVKMARTFLIELLDPKETPRVPKDIRKKAYRILRHFPSNFDLELASKREGSVKGEPIFSEDDAWMRYE